MTLTRRKTAKAGISGLLHDVGSYYTKWFNVNSTSCYNQSTLHRILCVFELQMSEVNVRSRTCISVECVSYWTFCVLVFLAYALCFVHN